MAERWEPIETVPLDAEKPFLVWLPRIGAAVSAYADRDRGELTLYVTDRNGCNYGLPLDEEASHWCWPTGPGESASDA